MHWAAAFFAGDSHPDHHKPLDGLRGLAVLMVVFGHGANHDLGPFGPDSMMIRGKLGVYLFFVLSAYLLDRQIIKMFQQGRAQWDYWLYYISRRVLRIFPLFFLALVVFRLANASGLKLVIHSWGQVLEHITLQRGDHIFWSIPVEFKYYLISPILLYFFHRVLRWNLWAMGITFAILFAGVYQYSVLWQPEDTSTLLYLNIFLMGTLVADWNDVCLIFGMPSAPSNRPLRWAGQSLLPSASGRGKWMISPIPPPSYPQRPSGPSPLPPPLVADGGRRFFPLSPCGGSGRFPSVCTYSISLY